MLDRAKNFLDYPYNNDQINLGANIYFLEMLIEHNYIVFNFDDAIPDLPHFINSKIETLKQVNPIHLIDEDQTFEYEIYLGILDETLKIIEVDIEFDTLFTTNEDAKFFLQNYEAIGKNRMFKFDLNILDGLEDYQTKLSQHKKENRSPLEILSLMDQVPENATWPYTHFHDVDNNTPLPIFAFQGFSENINKKFFDPTGFFYALLENQIRYVIALGVTGDIVEGYDFPPYFIIQKEYVKTDINGNIILKVIVTPQPNEEQSSEEYYQHILQCDFEILDPTRNEFIKKSMSIGIFNIPVLDGYPIHLREKSRQLLFKFLLEQMRKGNNIAAHCQAGRGRTGELIAELITLFTGRFDYFFADDDRKNTFNKINNFIFKLRLQRAGLLLGWKQICLYLITSYQYLFSEQKLEQEKRKRSSSLIDEREPPQKKLMHSSETSSNKTPVSLLFEPKKTMYGENIQDKPQFQPRYETRP